MYSKFFNEKTQQYFVVSTKAADHYKDNPQIKYFGKCDEKGNVTVPYELDEEYKQRTLQDHIKSVESNMKKKNAKAVSQNLGGELTTDIDDEA